MAKSATQARSPWIHPQAQAILDRIVASGEPPLETLTPEAARAVADPRVIRTAGKGPELGAVEDRAIPGPAGPVPLRIYKPRPGGAAGPLPILIYIHGGGYVLGNLDTADAICRELVVRAGCLVVSVHYRLAPEHKFPAAAEDCYAAALWTARHAAELGGDPRRIAIGGESAGGTLSAVITQRGRDRGELAFVLQLMVYPSTDVGAAFPSHARLAEGYFLTPRKMRWFHDHYIRDARDADDPLASPLRCKDFAGLPPALVITGDLDPLVDEGAAYAERLAAAGVPTVYRCYEGWPHGFMYWAGTEAQTRAFDDMAAALRGSFAGEDVTAPAAAPRLAFSHVGLWVSDLARMERFYSDLLGYTVTDRGDLGTTQLVFLSQDPAEHHQIVLAAGRPADATFSVINQLSLRAADLAALKDWHRRVRDAQVADLQPVTHGNAVSIYFRDPEGNRIEIFVDTPWYVPQPFRVPLDLDKPDAEIWRTVEGLCGRSPGHAPRADWQAAMQEKMRR